MQPKKLEFVKASLATMSVMLALESLNLKRGYFEVDKDDVLHGKLWERLCSQARAVWGKIPMAKTTDGRASIHSQKDWKAALKPDVSKGQANLFGETEWKVADMLHYYSFFAEYGVTNVQFGKAAPYHAFVKAWAESFVEEIKSQAPAPAPAQ